MEASFIDSLQDSRHVEIKQLEKNLFFDSEQLQELEKTLHTRYELEINLDGIESISHLLQQIEMMQDEIFGLKKKLHFYETT